MNIWGAAPRSVKTLLGGVLSAVPISLLGGRRFRKAVRFVREAQWWPAEKAREYQLERLRDICRLAQNKTAFYQRMFESAAFDPDELISLEQLQVLPTIDKNTVNAHLDEMCAVDPTSPEVDFASTGGTSGEPLGFYLPATRSAVEYAYLTTGWERAGYQLGVRMAVLRGRIVKADRTGLRHQYDPILRHHYYSTFHMTEQNMRRYVRHIARIGPCFLHAYPSSATVLARFLLAERLNAPANIRGVLLESEIVYPQQKRLLEEVFGVRVFSSYGHSEKLILAAYCEHSDNYHVWPTYGYFELLDEQGNPVTTPGQRGEIVGTGFINTVMPFIRYRTGDFATYVGDRCEACGRQHILIRDIRGHRTQEVLITADHTEISWTAMNMHDETFTNVRQFQFYQDRPGRAVLRVVPAPGFGEEDARRILANLDTKLDGQIRIEIELVESIRSTRHGKAIYVDQQIPGKAAGSRAEA